MWTLTLPVGELILRAVVIYIGVFLLFRLVGKKQLGEMSPFDFVLVVIVSEAVSNGLLGDEHSITGGLILASTLVALNYGVDFISFKSKKMEKIIDGEAQLLVSQGKVRQSVMDREKITLEELMSSVRRDGIEKLEDVRFAILETNGKISIIPQEK